MSDIKMKTISVTITPEQDKYLDDLIEINAGTNKSYFVRFALRVLFDMLEGGQNAK